MNIEILEDKYITFLLKRCLNVEKTKCLLVNYNIENQKIIDKLVKIAKEMGVDDIYLDPIDSKLRHDTLKNIEFDKIKEEKIFNKEIWDEYASKNPSFLLIRSVFPGLMGDIDAKKLAEANYKERSSCPKFREKQARSLVPWCIATLPSIAWAKKLFPNLDEKEAYEKLYRLIFKVCMIDDNDPIDNWNNFLENQEKVKNKLNSLKITNLHYKNSLGTDLWVELPEDALWQCAGSTNGDVLVNVPSYEIFTSPNYKKTEGIVYASKPLCYNDIIIKDFYIEFTSGKVSNFHAEEGEDLLKEIIEGDEYSCYLGEVALVNYDSPISNTNLTFYETTIDENAACHLALGAGFEDCIKNGLSLSKDELLKKGICQSKNHVDFMIGTSDLLIEAVTKNGTITLMKDGNIVI